MKGFLVECVAMHDFPVDMRGDENVVSFVWGKGPPSDVNGGLEVSRAWGEGVSLVFD